jgi:hypothetical protein
MAQAIIQQQPVDGDFDDAVDPETDISGDDSGMETDVDDTVHVGGNGTHAVLVIGLYESQNTCDVEMGKITSLLPVTSRSDVRV